MRNSIYSLLNKKISSIIPEGNYYLFQDENSNTLFQTDGESFYDGEGNRFEGEFENLI